MPNRWAYFICYCPPLDILSYFLTWLTYQSLAVAEQKGWELCPWGRPKTVALSLHRWTRWWNYLLNCKKTVLLWVWSKMLFVICFECMYAVTWRLKTNSVHMLCISSCSASICSLSLLTQWVSSSEVCLCSSHFRLSGSSCTCYKPADNKGENCWLS